MQQMQRMMSQGKMTPEAMKEMQGMMQMCQNMMQQMGTMMGAPPQPQPPQEKRKR